jgi:hypothetical protein
LPREAIKTAPFVLRLPPDLKAEAEIRAAAARMSLNKFIAALVADKLAELRGASATLAREVPIPPEWAVPDVVAAPRDVQLPAEDQPEA